MITNLHLPKSTLLMMVSAFAGHEFVKKAYQEAVKKKISLLFVWRCDAYFIIMDKARRDIRALTLEELRRFFTSNAVPAFKGNQVYEWLWSKGSHDFEGMTNLSKSHRSLLEEHFVINHIEVDHLQRSADGTIKNAIRLHDGFLVESVLIPTDSRATACVSSQVGCSLTAIFVQHPN